MSKCVICNEAGGRLVALTQRGLTSLSEFAKLRNDDRVLNELKENSNSENFVHEDCRKWYNNRKGIASGGKESVPKKTRQSILSFDWKNTCFFCSIPVNHKTNWHMTQTLTMKSTVLKICENRISKDANDAWAVEVKGRINECIDFVASEARYHRDCRAIFSSGRQLKPSKVAGRLVNNTVKTAFDEACECLENEAEIYTITEFAKLVELKSETDESFSHKYLTSLLKAKYQDHVLITSQGAGKGNIITFVDTAKYLIEEKFKSSKEQNVTSEKDRMVNIVGNLIKDEIRTLERSETYPSQQELKDVEFLKTLVPKTLQTLLEILIPNDIKRAAIGHAIISGSRANFNTPILFGVGVELDHCFGSKWLNNQMSRLGFSITNDEVRRYKQDILEKDETLPEIPQGSFVQWMADNVDHNVRTIDGKNTFHGMGIIASVTPYLSNSSVVKRSQRRKSIKDLTTKKGPSIFEYLGKAIPPTSIKFRPITVLRAAASLQHDETSLYNYYLFL